MPKSPLRFILASLSPAKGWNLGILLCIVAGELCGYLSWYTASRIADVLNSGDKDSFIQARDLALAAAGCFFGCRIAYSAIGFLEAKVLPIFRAKMSKTLFDAIHARSAAFFAEEMAGNIASKAKTMLNNSYNIYFNLVWGFFYPVAAVAVIAAFAAKTNPLLALMIIGLVIIYAALNYAISKRVAPYAEKTSNAESASNGVLVDGVANAVTVKGFGNTPYERRAYFSAVAKTCRADRQEIYKIGRLFLVQSVFQLLTYALFVLVPLWLWSRGKITVGDFMFVQMIAANTNGIYLHFTQQFMSFFRLYGGINDGLRLFSKPVEITDAPNAKPLEIKSKPSVEFAKIKFHYKTAQPLFADFTLTIKPGEKIGLVGHSGSGKSTLVKLLSRYYDLNGGAILINKQNIKDVTQDSLRRNIALIPQDTALFNRTIMENIRYGRLDAADEEVMEAAKKAYIHDFIETMPEGYQSKVGERGVMLSGGERQRIAIARAILKDAPILILDEATSALDSISEKHIHDSMKKLMADKTVIAIAHRLSTLKEMDRLVVLDKGKIVEMGTHGELIKKSPLYKSLYEMQFVQGK